MAFIRTVLLFLICFAREVLTECSEGCQSCPGSTCLSCEPFYFLANGLCSKCPEDCTGCNIYDCTSCKPNKHGLHGKACSFNCSGNCLNGECHDDTGYCMECKSGLYGQQCQNNCSLCEDESCNLRSCSHGCKEGYYEFKNGEETFCQSCPSDCRHCKDGKTCQECNDGFHLYEFNDNVHCILCSLGSRCLDYCVIQGCNECQIRNNSLTCIDCPEGQGFNGISCETNASPCSKECSTYCDSNGICQGECNDGWTGEKCAVKCSDMCLKCSKENGNICHQCKGYFYSTDCSLVCSSSCLLEEGNHICRQSDGYCLNGCQQNTWGKTCNKTCLSVCKDSTCDRNSGKCKVDCGDGYHWQECATSTPSRRTEIPDTTITTTTVKTETHLSTPLQIENKNNFVIGYFSGFGTCIVMVIVIVLIYFIRRRYLANNESRKRLGHDVEIPAYYNATTNSKAAKLKPASVDHNYESLSSNRVQDKEYCDLRSTTQQ